MALPEICVWGRVDTPRSAPGCQIYIRKMSKMSRLYAQGLVDDGWTIVEGASRDISCIMAYVRRAFQ